MTMTRVAPTLHPRPVAAAGYRTRAAALLRGAATIAAFFLAAWLALAPTTARADEVTDYEADNATLDQLLVERQDVVARLENATGAEQAALARLSATEERLHAVAVWQQDIIAQQPAAAERIAAVEEDIAALDAEQGRLERRVEAEERWLDGDVDRPEAYGTRSALAAAALLDDGLHGQLEAAQAQLEAARQVQARLVDSLGSANTEMATWRAQAESLAAQVGSARSRALAASGRLAALQTSGTELAAKVQAQFQALVDGGHPAGVAQIAGGPEPVAEPLSWPASAPSYPLPAGRTSASVVAGTPLFVTKDRLSATRVLEGTGDWVAPVKGQITTPFGDATPYQAAHYAIDIAARLYAPIVAPADGVVEYASLAASDNRLASYGMAVVLRHNDHVTTLYAHLDDRAFGVAVKPGDAVQRGQVIGYVGLTGYTTGPHLHFEVRIDNQPIDPLLLVKP
jgi:murein DD-endopeptidase MepM/ murein hydrolase activator NlpD